MCKIFSLFKNLDKLESLSLRCNDLNDEMAIALGEGLAFKKEIRTLDLGENLISGGGIKAIGDSLKTHVRLHQLFLDNNRFSGEEAAQGLAECLKNKQDLRILNLDNNKIGEEGAIHIAKNLKNVKGL